MSAPQHPIVLPDLGLQRATIRASCWLAARGATVVQGDRVLEVAAGEVTVDLPAPATGRLVEQRVAEEDILHVGQVLGVIREDESQDFSCRGS